ncbi:MAG: hypothetical protein GQE15_27215 [Archangiaceae bacterium]|nr:hypothetical protein [Archangiaceae bacterium]
MPRFVAIYTMKAEDRAAFHAKPRSERDAIDQAGLKAWEAWRARNAASLVGADVMVGRTKRVSRSGISDAHNEVAGFVIVEAADLGAAANLFQDHPHFTIFPGDGIDLMPVVSDPKD